MKHYTSIPFAYFALLDIYSLWFYVCVPHKNISLTVRGRLYSSCVRSSMLHRSETWPVRKENEVALQRAEMRMVRWMFGMKLHDINL